MSRESFPESRSRKPLTRLLTAIGVVVGLLASLVVTGGLSADAQQNPHPDYLVNIIGVSNPKKADLEDSQRRTIFVNLEGASKIMLLNSDELDDVDGFAVLDGNGTSKSDPAVFALPDPDVDGDGELDGRYTVSVRALGTPGGEVNIATCAEILGYDLTANNRKSKFDDGAYCTLEDYDVDLVRNNGQPLWRDVTDELLSITIEVFVYDEDGNVIGSELVTIPLFDEAIEGEFWQYDNNGMRLVQLRFTLNTD